MLILRVWRSFVMAFLDVKGLHASIEGKEILTGLSLNVDKGEVHALMGPNGSGKSTFANVLLGSSKIYNHIWRYTC